MRKTLAPDPDMPRRLQQEPRRFQVCPHSFGFKPGIDLDRLNQLLDELEAGSIPESTEIVRRDRDRGW